MGQRLRSEAALRRRGPQRPEERHWVRSTGRADLEQSQSRRQSPLGGEGPPSPPSLYFWSSLSCSPASRASSQAAERPMAGSVLERVGGSGGPGECGYRAHAFLGTPVLSVSLYQPVASVGPWPWIPFGPPALVCPPCSGHPSLLPASWLCSPARLVPLRGHCQVLVCPTSAPACEHLGPRLWSVHSWTLSTRTRLGPVRPGWVG